MARSHLHNQPKRGKEKFKYEANRNREATQIKMSLLHFKGEIKVKNKLT